MDNTIAAKGLAMLEASDLFGRLPASALRDLVESGRHAQFAPGQALYSAGSQPRTLLILEGLVRLFMVGPEGRQSTVWYVRSGQVLGISALGGNRPQLSAESLTFTSSIEFQRGEMDRLVRLSPEFGRELSLQLIEISQGSLAALELRTFGSMRERVIHHLLAVATRDAQGRFRVNLNHQQLADAVGSVRDVVARALRELRDDYAVELRRGGIVILDAPRLQSELRDRFGPMILKAFIGQPYSK